MSDNRLSRGIRPGSSAFMQLYMQLFVFRPWVVGCGFVMLCLCLGEDDCAVRAAVEEEIVGVSVVDYRIHS